MSRKRTKQYLMLLMVIGLVSIAAGGSGTFASFNAETTNANNTFATGTLVLSDKVGATTCYSNEATTTDNLNANCSVLLNTANLSPQHSETALLTVKNEGTIAGQTLHVFIPKTQTGALSCLNANGTYTFQGTDALPHTGDVCGQLKFSVEEDATLGGTASACLIGTAVGGGNNACDPTQGTSFGTFYGSNYDSSHMADTTAAMAAGQTHFFKVYMYLPDENNSFQNRTAKFDITWHLDQA